MAKALRNIIPKWEQLRLLALCWVLAIAHGCLAAQPSVQVGSKRFTESYILGEILAQTATRAGEVRAHHKPGLGNTGIVFSALRAGAIDLYPEYTGTIANELLADPTLTELGALNRALAPMGLVAFAPLGFNNTYALAMREEEAQRRNITRLSDLRGHGELRYGLSQEFMSRKDGWPAVSAAYGLDATPRGLDHGLAYEALAGAQVDVIDLYSTDAKQVRYRLRVLLDDRHVFPAYQAVILARSDLRARAPATWQALEALADRLNEPRMTALNAEAELQGRSFREVAEGFLGVPSNGSSALARAGPHRFLDALFAPALGRLTTEHLYLVLISLAAAVAVGVPLGVCADRSTGLRRVILTAVAIVQTVPALALLAFLIPIMSSIGTGPALVALFLYSLLPIVRNTVSGLQDIPSTLRESALALGFSARARLVLIELPLAARSILAGVKTSAVLNVGTATIAAFIGAGGYGERIASGLALNDNALLLAGAAPAAAMALLVQAAFDLAERYCISPGLRLTSGDSRHT
jgi:osmoprotectant transport system permease protein